MVRNHRRVAADTWRDNGGTVGTVRELSGCLVVTQTAATQRVIAQLLDQLREVKSLNVMVETHFIAVSDAELRELGVKAGASGPPAASDFLSTEPTFLTRTTLSIPDRGSVLLGGLEDPGDRTEPASATQPAETRPVLSSDATHDPHSRLFILVKSTIIFPHH